MSTIVVTFSQNKGSTATFGGVVYTLRSGTNWIYDSPLNPTSIPVDSFKYQTTLTGLSIPSSVTSIGDYAFEGCSALAGSLVIPDSVVTIGNYAFYNCSGFTGSLTIPDSVTSIGQYAFNNCLGFTGSLIIGNSVTSIGEYAFQSCLGLTGSLVIPNSVTSIGTSAFNNCLGFTGSLIIGNSVTSIGQNAFFNCSGFTGSLTIPDSVQTIGISAFYGCSGFTGSLTIGNSVTSIGNSAFQNCSEFTGSLTIPNSVTTIGNNAFFNCSRFNGSLTIPASVVTIANSAFQNCSGFTGSLTIPNSVVTIANSAFQNCSSFNGSLTIPASVTTIGNDAFSNCSSFNGSLTIPNSVQSIGGGAFSNCSGFTSLTIPTSVQTIGNDAFSACSGFTGSLTIPASVQSIGAGAFYGCSGFTGSLTIPDSVTSIEDLAFRDCSGFTSLTIGNTVTSIGVFAFSGCSTFTGSVTIPISVTSIGLYAFHSCPNLLQFIFLGSNIPILGNVSNTIFGGGNKQGTAYYVTGATPIDQLQANFNNYVSVVAPTVSGVSPDAGPLGGGQSITITGTDFISVSSVTIGGSTASNVFVIGATGISATTPAKLTAGSASVIVTTIGGTNAPNTLYNYIDVPTVSSVNPDTGPLGGGQSITITGTGFTAVSSVTIGGATATSVQVLGATGISATTPAGLTTGSASVIVTTIGGTNAPNALYNYVSPPSITTVTPNTLSRLGGELITIIGQYFVQPLQVYIDGTPLSPITVTGDTEIQVTSIPHPVGLATLTVTTPQGTASVPITYVVPCFAKGTKILCLSKETRKEEYKVIESLRKGDLVKTLKHGFVAIHMIGHQDMYNAASENHSERMLYKCSREQYPELLEDLIITGHHSILVDRFKEGERAKTEKVLGDIYVTDQKYRLPACVDKRARPYKKEGMFTVYHFSLENDNDYMNYGVYANGLLVETSSKRYLRDLSGMHII